jgi:ABC-2 type transport system permease protein
VTRHTSGFLTRLIALIRKETRQMLRDRSNLMVGLLLPAALILLFGYGLSFDVRDAPVAVVLEDRSETARDAVAGLSGSPYLAPVAAPDMGRAVALLRAHTVDAIVRVPVDFTARKAAGEGRIQVLLNGYDATTAMTIGTYIDGAIQLSVLHDQDRKGPGVDSGGSLGLVQRVWFNAASISTWYLVPGLLVLVITLIGAFLTSLLIAREWERGTLESLFVTPVRPLELVMAKLAPYMVIGAIDVALCLASARFLFHVPIRGSLGVIVVSSLLYLSVSLMLGLLISGVTRNQFAASQMAMLASFMPATMLSGFVYDIHNMPTAIRVISLMLPATHFMDLIKGLFLAGTVWPLVFKSCGLLLLYLVGLGFLATRTLRKRLD